MSIIQPVVTSRLLATNTLAMVGCDGSFNGRLLQSDSTVNEVPVATGYFFEIAFPTGVALHSFKANLDSGLTVGDAYP